MSVRILIEGKPNEVALARERVKQAFDVVGYSNPRQSRKAADCVVVHVEAEVMDRSVTP